MTQASSDLPPEAYWRQALRQGRFLLQRDRTTGVAIFPPRFDFSGEAITWIEASGRGTVYAVTQIAQRPPAADYNVVLVDLEEGPRLMTTVEGVAPETVTIGMAVRAHISLDAEEARLVFHPA